MALQSKKTQTKNSESKVKHIGLVKNDAYLAPYEEAIKGRHDHALWKLNSLTNNGKTKLTDFANGHKYYGLHSIRINDQWRVCFTEKDGHFYDVKRP